MLAWNSGRTWLWWSFQSPECWDYKLESLCLPCLHSWCWELYEFFLKLIYMSQAGSILKHPAVYLKCATCLAFVSFRFGLICLTLLQMLSCLFSALLHKILVENPSARITIPDIKKDRWYNKPLNRGKSKKSVLIFLWNMLNKILQTHSLTLVCPKEDFNI